MTMTRHAPTSIPSHQDPRSLFDTGIRVRGPLSKKTTPLAVGDPSRATMYVCGVTAYDHCHLGHARSACSFDLIARHLRSKVGTLFFARNVTDIDDKIIARAAMNGEGWLSLARRMEQSMQSDFAALGCSVPDHEPRATDHIPDMIDHIGSLMSLGLAYASPDGSVWRDGSTWHGVGKVSGRRIEDLISGSRAAAHPGKRSERDFVLWKAAKPNEPSWPSPWGLGRPGWHIECSAMIRKTLGDSVDVHGGGEDLKFPHHECECAQSEPVTGLPLARHWIHNGFVVLPKTDGSFDEMHKSSGNALNIQGLLALHPGEAIRAWALSAHYRQPLPYSDLAMEQARSRAWRWALAREAALSAGARPDGKLDPDFSAALDADFNTPLAFSRLDALAKAAKADPSGPASGPLLASLSMAGLGLASSSDLAPQGRRSLADNDSEGPLPELSRRRDAARAAKDWALADQLRLRIQALGYEVNDSPLPKTAKP